MIGWQSMRAWLHPLLMAVALLATGAAWAQEQRPDGWLGVNIQDVTTEEAAALGWKTPRGSKVTRPVRGSPAEAAGLAPGDVITAVDGAEVQNAQAVLMSLAGKSAGTVVRLQLMRAGTAVTAAVTLGVRPEDYALAQQAAQLYKSHKFKESLAVTQQALALAERRVGPDDEWVARLLTIAAGAHDAQRNVAESEALYQRAIAINEKAFGPEHPNVAAAIEALASSYAWASRYADAEALYQRALAIREKASQRDIVAIGNTLGELARLYSRQSLHSKAGPLFQRALAMMETARGPDHPDVRHPLGKLAEYYEGRRSHDAAEPLRRRALAIAEKALGPDHPEVRNQIVVLAFNLKAQDRLEEAAPLFERALALQEKFPSPNLQDLENAFGNLASLYDRLQRYDDAERVSQRRLAVMEKLRGPDHPELRYPLSQLALFYKQRRRYDEAEKLQQRAVAIAEKAFGPDHVSYRLELSSLLDLYLSQHRYAEVEQIRLRVLANAERAHGPDHPNVREPLEDLARLYAFQLRRPDKAEPLYQRVLAIVEKGHGPDHPEVLAPLDQLARHYGDQRRYADAEPLLKRLLAITERTPGPDRPGAISFDDALGRLAWNYRSLRRYDEAEKLYQRALAKVEKARGPDHPDVRAPLAKLMGLYEERGRKADGEQQGNDRTELFQKMELLHKRALAIAEKALGPGDPGLESELSRLAGFYQNQNRYAEAEPLYRRLVAIVEKARGADHQELRYPLSSLASFYERQDKYAEALPLRERALAIARKAPAARRGDWLDTVDRLASLYEKLGQNDKSEAVLKGWLTETEKALHPDHEDLVAPINRLASFYEQRYRYADEMPLRKRALALAEKMQGPESYIAKSALDRLAYLYRRLGRFAEAEPLYKRKLAQAEKESAGTDSPEVRIALDNLADVYREQGRYADAVPLARRVLAIAEKVYATENDDILARWAVQRARADLASQLREAGRIAEAEEVSRGALASAQHYDEKASALLDLATLFRATARWRDAETHYRRALDVAEAGEKAAGYAATDVSSQLTRARLGLALLLHGTGRLAEADTVFRDMRPAAKAVGAVDANFANIFGNYAQLLSDVGRHGEALELSRRALAIWEKLNGPDHPNVASALRTLGGLLWHAGHPAESEPVVRRAIAILDSTYGSDHPNVANALNTLALILQSTNRASEAEAVFRRAVTIAEKAHGPDHRGLAVPLHNLALLMYENGRTDEAESLMRRAVFIGKSTFGSSHPNVALFLHRLAIMRAQNGDWVQAAALQAHAKPVLLAAGGGAASDRADLAKVLLRQHSEQLRFHAVALHRAGARSTAARAEAFELAQWALQSDAAEALNQMSARFSKGDGPLASLVRERQTLVAQRQDEDKRILEAIGKADQQSLKGVYASRDETKRRLESIDAELAAKFPEYSGLANPKPLTFAETQALLRPDEAIILLVDGPQFGQRMQLPEDLLVWVVTKAKVSWHRASFGSRALVDAVVALRCGLDAGRWDRAQSKERCRDALKGSGYESFDEKASSDLPFDLTRAHTLYTALLGPAQSLIKDKHLIVVPSGPLTSLPFGVLVTEPPKAATPATLADYRRAAWLGTRQPISVLPSVASLAALRRHAHASQAPAPFIGFGDPALAGNSGCGTATVPDQCPDEGFRVAQSTHMATRNAQSPAAVTSYFRAGLANVAALREACPLPETAYELRCVARSLAAAPNVVLLGKDMTEAAVKAAPLSRYRVVHFATHGLLAGETAQFAKDRAEPALLMTPPAVATEEDDGLLTASEVAGLKLDADWVVLSACNTASGRGPGAEALSGLARAFFYAGARALLVSHWYVDSHAATLLTSRTFAEMRNGPGIGRAEAFRRAMLAVMSAHQRPWDAHPSMWAPFVVVGEGAGLAPAPVVQPAAKARAATRATRAERSAQTRP